MSVSKMKGAINPMKIRFFSLLCALALALSAMTGVLAETADDMALFLLADEPETLPEEAFGVDLPEELPPEVESIEIPEDALIPSDGPDASIPLPASPNSYTDGKYDKDAFEIDGNGVLLQ